ncbi:MAG: hypothetical protein A3J29_10805 [Acidobacteria bacterium RIFCSPLOWO2_12_FULL_67_14b]|nr:MAG: hypothetical protein A3J29_10805 [Acidobacteria bacterium RIFCSPLOWO2_12_FULL_67_14b]
MAPIHSTRAISASAIGTYSMKFPCTRIARPISGSPPSNRLIFFFARRTVTRTLIATSIRARTPVKIAVIGIGKVLMVFLREESSAAASRYFRIRSRL